MKFARVKPFGSMKIRAREELGRDFVTQGLIKMKAEKCRRAHTGNTAPTSYKQQF